MSVSRKCPDCGTWNDDLDYCAHCGKLLNYSIQRQQEVAQQERAYKERQLDYMEQKLATMKASPYGYIRFCYHILYSVWFTFIVISSFLISLIVAAAG